MLSGLKFIPRDHIDKVSYIVGLLVIMFYSFVACVHL